MAKPINTALAVGLALAAIGLGCGPQEASDPVATTLTESEPAPDRPPPPPSAANRVEATPTNALQIRDRVSTAAPRSAEGSRSDPMEPTSEAYTTERAELLSELDSSDPEARADAADWIDLDPEVLERMISLLKSDPDAEVRATIVDRLGEEASPSAVAALVAALRDPDSEVVLRAIEVLEFEAESWLIPELEPLLAHPDPEVREAAQDAITYLE